MVDLSFLLTPKAMDSQSGTAEDETDESGIEQAESMSESEPTPTTEDPSDQAALEEMAVAARREFEDGEYQSLWKFLGSTRWQTRLELNDLNEAARALKGDERKEFVRLNRDYRNELLKEWSEIPAREAAEAKSNAELLELQRKAERLELQVKKISADRDADRLEAQERRTMYVSMTRA